MLGLLKSNMHAAKAECIKLFYACYKVTVIAHFFADNVEISLTVLPVQRASTWQWNYSRIHTEHHGELQCHQIGC